MTFIVLTWRGTIVYQTEDGQPLTHAPIGSAGERAVPFEFTPAINGQQLSLSDWTAFSSDCAALDPSGQLGAANLRKLGPGRLFSLAQDGLFLCADDGSNLLWNRPHAQTWESFAILTKSEYQRLSSLLTRFWTREPAGVLIDRRDTRLGDAFKLHFDKQILDIFSGTDCVFLSNFSFDLTDEHEFQVHHSLKSQRYRTAREPARQDSLLTNRATASSCRVRSLEEFQTKNNVQFVADFESKYFLHAPIFLFERDRKIFFDRFYNDTWPYLGRQEQRAALVRESDKFVVLTRLGEGVVFDENGACTPAGFLQNVRTLPPYFKRRGKDIYVDLEYTRRTAPRSQRKLVVFYNGNLQNYYHWLIEAMIPLDFYAESPIDGFELLMPPALSREKTLDYAGIMRGLGLDSLPQWHADGEIVQADEVLWIEGANRIETVPVQQLRLLNQRIRQRIAPSTSGRGKIFIHRKNVRCVANQAQLNVTLASWGFSFHYLENMDFMEQVALFQSAEFVIAPHGAGLSNLLFCSPGTKVIELMPEVEMRPFFWVLASKLDLPYAILHCRTVANGQASPFNQAIEVNMAHLESIYKVVSDNF